MRSLFLTVLIMALLPSAFITPFIGVLVWSWVSFMSPHRLVWGIGDSLPWAVIVGSVGIAGWLVSERRRIPMDATTVLLALLAILFTISTYYSLVPDLAWVKWQAILKEFVFFFITAALVTNRVRVHALMWIMVISISYYGIKGGVFTLLTGGTYRVWGPAMSEISDNNQLAAALVMVLPLMNYLGRQSKNEILRFGSRISMGFCLLSILASYSRGAFIALAAMVLWLWRHTRHKLISVVVIGGTLAGAVTFMPSDWVARMSSIQNYEQDASAEGRLQIWATAIKIAVARPLVGGGFYAPYTQSVVDQYSPGVQARAVHSIWLEVLGENGFPAFFVWTALMLVGLANCRFIIRRTKDIPELRWANDLGHMSIVALLGYAVGGSFLSLPYWDFYYTLLVLIACVRRITVQELAAMGKIEPTFAERLKLNRVKPPVLPVPQPQMAMRPTK
ncbi:MAG TPA: putative O-glycosylation ligase, exosortase A system-associated [Stellaceae bacterium]|nr:putative O-glycosylation ligase, exosortase A system-associated [Stellaceae bacterium]